MRLIRVAAGVGPIIVLHPQVTVVTGVSPDERRRLTGGLRDLPRGAAPGLAGEIEVGGATFDLGPDSLARFDLAAEVDLVIDARDLARAAGLALPEVADELDEERERLEAELAAAREVAVEAEAEAARQAAEHPEGDAGAPLTTDERAELVARVEAIEREVLLLQDTDPGPVRFALELVTSTGDGAYVSVPEAAVLAQRWDDLQAKRSEATGVDTIVAGSMGAQRERVALARRALWEAARGDGGGQRPVEEARAQLVASEQVLQWVLAPQQRRVPAHIEQEEQGLRDEAARLTGVVAVGDVGALLRRTRGTGERLVDLQAALGEVGFALDDTDVDEATLVVLAELWLDEQAEVAGRRTALLEEGEAVQERLDADDPDRHVEAAAEAIEGATLEISSIEVRLSLLAAELDRMIESERVDEEGEDGDEIEVIVDPSRDGGDPVDTGPGEEGEDGEELPAELSDDQIRDLEWYVLTRVAALRDVSGAGSLPMVFDDPFGPVGDEASTAVLDAIVPLAGRVQVVVFTDSEAVVGWAERWGADRVAVFTAG